MRDKEDRWADVYRWRSEDLQCHLCFVVKGGGLFSNGFISVLKTQITV